MQLFSIYTVVRTQLAEVLDARCENNGWRVKTPIKVLGRPSEAETQGIVNMFITQDIKHFEDDISTRPCVRRLSPGVEVNCFSSGPKRDSLSGLRFRQSSVMWTTCVCVSVCSGKETTAPAAQADRLSASRL